MRDLQGGGARGPRPPPPPRTRSRIIVTVKGLYFRYKRGAKPVFRDFSLEVAAGERLAILGPSEAGKSTLALALNGLIPRMIKGDFRGEIWVDGGLTHVSRPRDLASRVGVLFQDFEAQLFATRVDQEVAFGPENLGLPRPELARRVARTLALVGLPGLEERDPATLSGGQRQLLALAAVLSLRPRLLVLDEPTTDLDPARVKELMSALHRLSREEAITLILLGEDVRLARHATRVVLLDRGEVTADGPPETVLREVATFRRLGLNPPPLPAFFHDLGEQVLPLTLEEALDQARQRGWEAGGAGPVLPEAPVSSPAPEILALRGVTFSYAGGPPVLENLSLSFREGELTAILGENGSGKTTLLKVLRGLLRPQRGEVWSAPETRSGFVFQNPDYQLFAEEVYEEVALGPRQLGLPEDEVRRRTEIALARVHLLERAGEDPFSLTKGQRQRLAVASVLALAPRVIILDEPTTGLDHREQLDLLALIRELHAQGHTVIMVTHSLWAAAHYANRLIVLREGRVLLDGPTREVLAQEEILARSSLEAPPLVQLSRRLGGLAVTPEDFAAQFNLSQQLSRQETEP